MTFEQSKIMFNYASHHGVYLVLHMSTTGLVVISVWNKLPAGCFSTICVQSINPFTTRTFWISSYMALISSCLYCIGHFINFAVRKSRIVCKTPHVAAHVVGSMMLDLLEIRECGSWRVSVYNIIRDIVSD